MAQHEWGGIRGLEDGRWGKRGSGRGGHVYSPKVARSSVIVFGLCKVRSILANAVSRKAHVI